MSPYFCGDVSPPTLGGCAADSSIYVNLTGSGNDTQVKLGGPKYPESLWE